MADQDWFGRLRPGAIEIDKANREQQNRQQYDAKPHGAQFTTKPPTDYAELRASLECANLLALWYRFLEASLTKRQQVGALQGGAQIIKYFRIHESYVKTPRT
jgi:hypothetical protein